LRSDAGRIGLEPLEDVDNHAVDLPADLLLPFRLEL
jgi:hypothetical protein